MSFKKEKGITIVSLIIAVILMLILAGVAINYGTNSIDKAKLEDIKTDMISIKTRAKIVAEQYNFKDIEALVGSTITDEEAQKIGQENSEEVRKWSSSDLSNQGLSSIEGDKYIVKYDLENPSNSEVYYLEGYENMHSLTQYIVNLKPNISTL